MNKDQFEGKWHEFKGKIKEKWGKLTDNDITQINGKYEKFLGSLQTKYGYKKEQAEKEFNNWNWGTPSERNQLNREEDSIRKESQNRDVKDRNKQNRFDPDKRDEDNRDKKRKAG